MRFIQINDTHRINPQHVSVIHQPATGPPKVHVVGHAAALDATLWIAHANALSEAVHRAPWTLHEQFPPPSEPE